jgi:hypothetical protein
MNQLVQMQRAVDKPPHLLLRARPEPGETITDRSGEEVTVVNVNGRGQKWAHIRARGRVVYCTWEVVDDHSA